MFGTYCGEHGLIENCEVRFVESRTFLAIFDHDEFEVTLNRYWLETPDGRAIEAEDNEFI